MVDHEGDYYSFTESSVVHYLNIGQVGRKLWCDDLLYSRPTLAMYLEYKCEIILTIIANCNCTIQCSSMTYS